MSTKVRKTTLKEFNQFKKSFLHWQQKLSLGHFRIVFEVADLPESYAQIQINAPAKIATVRFCSDVPVDRAQFLQPERSAKHEAIHLFLNQLSHLGSCRYLDSQEIPDMEEGMTNILEELL